jgi:endonuclease/exonuclease/phosphatase family metal-dependent hydrolase
MAGVAGPISSLAYAAVTFSLLSYNVHGISWLFAKDNPQDRMITVGWLANRYDVVLLQEDFEYHDEIGKQMTGVTAVRGNGMRLDPRLVLTKVALLPFELLLPDFSFPYGSGLSAFVNKSAAKVVETRRYKFDDCSGWFDRSADCWATKGVLIVRLRFENGAEVDVYNTHLDAGQAPSAMDVRADQLSELIELVNRESAGRAVIVAGDFNTALDRMENVEAMRLFKQATGLVDAGAGPDLPQWVRRDFIFARDGDTVSLNLTASGEALEFVNRNRALSDHPAAYTRFEVQPK